ncbi:MAG: Gx transporter family protein [Clostridia bacterium]|nr:Gx transporter family protein [Clostridia bacterium]
MSQDNGQSLSQKWHKKRAFWARLALLSALMLSLSALEELFAPLMPVGTKPGLANIPVMLVLAEYGLGAALLLALFKAAFALVTRGVIAFLMSLAGGLVSTLLMWLLFRFAQKRVGLVAVSVLGALSHNMAQLLVATLLLGRYALYYAPVLALLAIPCGAVTGVVLYAVLRLIERRVASLGQSGKNENENVYHTEEE